MARYQRLVLILLVISGLLGTSITPLSAMPLHVEGSSNQYTQLDIINTDWQNYQDIPEYFELVAENQKFQLFADEITLAFKVVDKRSGYIWHSNLDEVTKDDKLNKTWTAFARSGISIEYLDPKAVSKRASITNTNQSIEYRKIDQGFQATIKFNDASISLDVIVQLEAAGVSVAVPFETIKEEDPDYKLALVYVYPFFGATKEDSVPGYMFIPDGSGSLIRFNTVTKAKNMYYGRYYGADLGMLTTLPFDPMIKRPFKISIPVIGMVHGYKQNAYISIVEKGASYGEIHAHPAGIITTFNFLYNAFIYNESYFQATNRSGAGVTTIQQSTNKFDVKIHYRFLTGDDSDYVGMARSYQKYLIDQGVLHKNNGLQNVIGIKLEFLGGEKEKVLFWNRSIPMTTVSQMADILNDIDIKNPQVVYYGWQPLGASTMAPKSLKVESKLGTVNELRSLVDSLLTRGGDFYLYLDPQAALRNEKGYSPRFDLAMSITNANLMGYNRNKVNYYLNYNAVSERYSSLSDEVSSKFQAGLALDGISSTLYSDFKRGNFLNREEAIEMYQSLFAAGQNKTAFYMPNDYFFGYMSAYYDIPLSSSGYLFTTDTIPFLQIVLAGYVPYYGSALNFSSNLQDDLLRSADFGVFPSYYLSHQVTAEILNTSSSWIYTSSYNQWGQEIETTYRWLNNILGQVSGHEIIARQVLEPGIVVTTYSNGKQILVNYTDEPYTVQGIVISGKDAVVMEVVP